MNPVTPIPTGIGSPSRPISISMLRTNSDCDHLFKVRYIDGKRGNVTMSYFKIGSVVHEAIEEFHEKHDALLSELLGLLNAAWASHFDSELSRQLAAFYQERQEAIIVAEGEFLERTGRPTKNVFATKVWEDQEERFVSWADQLELYKERFPDVVFKKPLVELYLDSVTCINNFFLMHEARGVKSKNIISEFAPDESPLLFGERVTGKIDRLEMHGDDFRVADYKTGGYYNITKVANDDQLHKYSHIVKECFGRYPTHISIWNLKRGEIIEHVLHERDTEAFSRRWRARVNRVRFTEELVAKAAECGEEFVGDIPAGKSMSLNCPCSLAYEIDPELKCPYMNLYEENKVT